MGFVWIPSTHVNNSSQIKVFSTFEFEQQKNKNVMENTIYISVPSINHASLCGWFINRFMANLSHFALTLALFINCNSFIFSLEFNWMTNATNLFNSVVLFFFLKNWISYEWALLRWKYLLQINILIAIIFFFFISISAQTRAIKNWKSPTCVYDYKFD